MKQLTTRRITFLATATFAAAIAAAQTGAPAVQPTPAPKIVPGQLPADPTDPLQATTTPPATATPATPAQPVTPTTPTSPATPANPARAELAKARQNLEEVTRRLQAEVDAKPELADAVKAVTDAKATYDQASANAVATLANNPDYKAAEAAAATARQNMESLNASGNVTPESRAATATAALNAKEALARLQSQVLATDPNVQQAKTAYTAAAGNLTKLRAQFANLSQNPEWVAAHDAVEAARQKAAGDAQATAAANRDRLKQQQADRATLAAQHQQPTAQPYQQQQRTTQTPVQPPRSTR